MRRLKTESRITSYEFIHVFTSHKTFQGNEQTVGMAMMKKDRNKSILLTLAAYISLS